MSTDGRTDGRTDESITIVPFDLRRGTKKWRKGREFQETEMYIILNERNTFLLKNSQLSISQSRSSSQTTYITEISKYSRVSKVIL